MHSARTSKKGLAKLLFEAVENDLKEKHYQGRIRLCSLANNELANSCYLKNGFKPYEITFEKEFAQFLIQYAK